MAATGALMTARVKTTKPMVTSKSNSDIQRWQEAEQILYCRHQQAVSKIEAQYHSLHRRASNWPVDEIESLIRIVALESEGMRWVFSLDPNLLISQE